jgi:hypothetical protein
VTDVDESEVARMVSDKSSTVIVNACACDTHTTRRTVNATPSHDVLIVLTCPPCRDSDRIALGRRLSEHALFLQRSKSQSGDMPSSPLIRRVVTTRMVSGYRVLKVIARVMPYMPLIEPARFSGRLRVSHPLQSCSVLRAILQESAYVANAGHARIILN